MVAAAHTICLWAEVGLHPRQASSLLQGHIERQTIICICTHTYSQFWDFSTSAPLLGSGRFVVVYTGANTVPSVTVLVPAPLWFQVGRAAAKVVT